MNQNKQPASRFEFIPSNYNILILDDSKSINQMLTKSFNLKGYNCISVYCIKDAKEALENNDIHYVMLDINLPDGNGYELITQLEKSSVKIFVLTTENDKQFREVTYEKGILEDTKKKFDLPDNFILFVGSIEPRKNLITLLKAYTKLCSKDKDNTPLVLVGFKGWENKEIMKLIDKEKSHIKYLGYVEDEELPHVYNLASMFVFPTHYEGFGIPPIEAFACGTPVIVSNVASLPEVCSDAALYINPNDEDDLKDKIETLLNDNTLQKELIKKGLEKVKEYSWEKAAKKHLEIFNKVLNNDK
mgnify:CR=1 FL=1